MIAAFWRKRADPPRANYVYWYNQYGLRTPYELFESAPPAHRSECGSSGCALMADDRVLEVRPEY